MTTFLLILQAIIGAALVGVILMQQSEGGGLGMGGSPSGLMSARGAADFLTRATAVLASLFVVLSIIQAVRASRLTAPTIDTSLARPAAPATGALPGTGPTTGATPPVDPLAAPGAPVAVPLANERPAPVPAPQVAPVPAPAATRERGTTNTTTAPTPTRRTERAPRPATTSGSTTPGSTGPATPVAPPAAPPATTPGPTTAVPIGGGNSN